MAEGKREHALYGRVAKFAEARLGCFKTATSTGLKTGLVDIVGVRHMGGRLAGESEVIAIEVKTGSERFATSAGQARSYAVYADRCYLAVGKPGSEEFSGEESDIASNLGVGLIRIGKSGVEERLAAPRQVPIERMRQDLLFHIGCAQCAVCGAIFDLGRGEGTTDKAVVRSSSHRGVVNAVEEEKGLVWWLGEVSERQAKKKGGQKFVDPWGRWYARRYLCSDCVWGIFRQVTQR